jgi:tetratricopeptide (TPR) repeat protein
VGRPERGIPGDGNPLTEFARGLRALRRAAGQPSYRRLAAVTHCSPSTLARAAGGQALPSQEIALAYVNACGGDAGEWRDAWDKVAAWLSAQADAAATARDGAQPAAQIPEGHAEGPAQLPPDTADFTGREEQVSLVCGLLGAEPAGDRPGAVAISAVAGMGGIGKTALAVHVAHRLTSRFPDGQLYADLLGATRPVRPAEVLGRFLRDLGVPDDAVPADEPERVARFRTLIAHRRMLIVLDDARDAAQVRPLLPGTATCGVIVTSRSTLAGLPGTALLDLEELGESEARELFTTIVGAGRTAAEPGATASVLAHCAGLPLAVRIAASRLASRPGWSIAHLAAKLAGQRDRLAELAAGDLAVQASFAVSYDALPGNSADGPAGARPSVAARIPAPRAPGIAGGAGPARVFRLLGLADMTVLRLPAVAALAGLTEDQAAEALETLADAHLVQAPSPDWYRLHDLLRTYAADLCERTDSTDERSAAAGRMLRWYAEQTVTGGRVLGPIRKFPVLIPVGTDTPAAMATAPRVLAWFEAELGNLTTAVRRAAALGRHDLAAQIAIAMWDFLVRTPHGGTWVAIAEAGVASARHLNDEVVLSTLLNSHGQACSQEGDHAEAQRSLAEALAIRRRGGDRGGEAKILNSIGIDLNRQGDYERALEVFQASQAIHLAHSAPAYAAITLNNAAFTLLALKRHDEALDYLDQALTLLQEVDDRYWMGGVESTLGDVYLDLGRYEDAVEHYRRSLAARYDISAEHAEGVGALCGMASALAALGRTEESRAAWLAAIPVLDRIGDSRAAQARDHLATPALTYSQ